MSKTAIVHARIEPQTKKKAETVLNRLGMSPTEAIRLFYHQICLHDGIPFEVRIPNKKTRDVLLKSRRGENIEAFGSLEEMFASWKK
jgi:DNA-damage-inducible protein J